MAMNATNSTLAQDILFALPRFARRAGVLAVNYLPEQLDGFFGKVLTPGRFVADATSISAASANMSSISSVASLASTASPGAVSAVTNGTAAAATAQVASILSLTTFFNMMRSITSFSSYVISRWALTTAIMVFTLGRVHVFASSRIPLRLNFFVRAFIYSVPIAFLTLEAISILRAIRCQTSPEWPIMRYHNESKAYPYDYAADGGFLYRMSSSALYKESDDESCQGVGMAALSGSRLPRGSLSLLWPLFLSLCASQFIEALAAALQGRQPVTENSIFEMSLAFAEAEALVIKPFELSMALGKGAVDATLPLKIGRVKQLMNVTPEVLLLSFIFALSTISSNILAVFNKRKKWRLVNTGVWGLTYLAAFMWSLNRLLFGEDDEWNFRFPTVFVVGFIPHLVIIVGTLICGGIYSCALLFTVLSPPAGPLEARSFKERLSQAYDNLQANVYLAAGESIRFSWEDEFYSTLLKAGFTLLTVASEAVYLNEGTNVRVGDMTWLEQNRVNELSSRQGLLFRKTQQSIPLSLKQNLASYPSKDEADLSIPGKATGYSVERKARGPKSSMEVLETPDGMLGVAERRSLLAFKFMQGIFWLSMSVVVLSSLALLNKIGVDYRPRWVRKLVIGDARKSEPRIDTIQNKPLDLWLLKDDGTFHLADDPSVDVEVEMRAQEERSTGHRTQNVQGPDMDSRLYNWWKSGGWWGEADGSGEFEPSDADDDLTSLASTAASVVDETENLWTDEESSGQRTPTKNDPFPRQQNQDDLLDASTLAALLDPQSTEQRQEARMLSRRLRTNGVMTRQRYQKAIDKDRAIILTTSRAFNPENKALEADMEEQMLEAFITEKRSEVRTRLRQSSTDGPSSWSSGAPGMGNAGPMCVICQDSPRTVLLWPCGCLSMCDDCRVSMATRNFTSCVCCRTATEAFSRLYVP